MTSTQTHTELPETGISGVYEVMIGVADAEYAIKYFGEFGFEVVTSGELDAPSALQLYGHHSKLTSYRLQNGDIDSHGLLRILVWDDLRDQGVGYTAPRTVGQRISVMMTKDIYRLHDIYSLSRVESKEQWLPTPPVSDDLFDLDKGKKGFFNRPVMVRENAVYGEFFNHIFFQRYGYKIPGYGTIGDHANLKTSEFTHHDFIIYASDMSEMAYLSTALGLQAEDPPELNGDWQQGPRQVFVMSEGESHMYQGFVSPNNICGKLKFIIPTSVNADRSKYQKVGAPGITLHSFYTPDITLVHRLVTEHRLSPTDIMKNEFEEDAFVFTGPAGCSWQIIANSATEHEPAIELKFELTND